MRGDKVFLIALWLLSVFTWWAAMWGGQGERTWEWIKGYRNRVAQLIGGSWSREDEVRLGKITSSILLVVMTLVTALVLWHS